jgi:hypothetical protein
MVKMERGLHFSPNRIDPPTFQTDFVVPFMTCFWTPSAPFLRLFFTILHFLPFYFLFPLFFPQSFFYYILPLFMFSPRMTTADIPPPPQGERGIFQYLDQ